MAMLTKADEWALRRAGITPSMVESLGAMLETSYTRFMEDIVSTIELIAPTRAGTDGEAALRELAQIIRRSDLTTRRPT